MWTRLTQRERVLVVIGLLVLFFALYFFYFYQPLQVEIKRLEAAREQKGVALTKAVSMARKLPYLKDKIARVNIKGNTVESPILTSEELLRLFEETTDRHGVDLISFVPREGEESIQINVLLDGSYYDITQFLSSIEETERNLRFNRLSVSGQDNLRVGMEIIYNRPESNSGDKL